MKNVKTLREKRPLPPRLIKLMQRGRWQHPGDDVMMAKVPFIRDPLVFLGTKEQMFATGPLMGADETENELFSEYRGSIAAERELPSKNQ
jgi:hypothetical protein